MDIYIMPGLVLRHNIVLVWLRTSRARREQCRISAMCLAFMDSCLELTNGILFRNAKPCAARRDVVEPRGTDGYDNTLTNCLWMRIR